jgi:hypothetical protein
LFKTTSPGKITLVRVGRGWGALHGITAYLGLILANACMTLLIWKKNFN